MPLTRRRFIASLTAGSAAWLAQRNATGADTQDMPDNAQTMQPVQRGGPMNGGVFQSSVHEVFSL